MLIYCDSVILIYYLDLTGPLHTRAANRLAAMKKAGDQIAFSDLSRLECRVGPMKRNDPAALAVFDGFFGRPDVTLVPVTRAVFDRATVIRAQLSFKTADSLHLAAAVEGKCDEFLTNDARLNKFSDLPVEILP